MAQKPVGEGNYKGVRYKVRYYKRYGRKCFARYVTSVDIVMGERFPSAKKMLKLESGRERDMKLWMHRWFMQFTDFFLNDMIDTGKLVAMPSDMSMVIADRADEMAIQRKEYAFGSMGQRYKAKLFMASWMKKREGIEWDVHLLKKYQEKIKENVKNGKEYR